MRKIFSILFITLCAISTQVKAQLFYSTTEFGVCGGVSEYFGDLNDYYGFRALHPAFGGFFRAHLNPYISLRASADYTKVGYDDSYSSNPYNKERNLNFQSNIFEVVAQAEFNFFRFATGDKDHRFTPYLTGGVGAFYYNPYTYFDGKKYYLKPIGTEGQEIGRSDRKYSNVSMCFPIGAGVKYWVKPGMNIGIEITDRLTMTDYLDDVSTTYVGANNFTTTPQNPNPAYYIQDRSLMVNPNNPLGRPGKQRGNSSTKDQYMMVMINFSFQLKVYRCPGYLKRGFVED